jgi:hypothetical protein
MFVRFVVPCKHDDSHRLTGVFQAACLLRGRGLLSHWEEEQYDALCQWFNRHLAIPGKLSRSRRRHACRNAICWFKAEATEYIVRVRAIAALIERCGTRTEMLRTRRPGYVVYEDAHQVAAVPFRHTRA